MLNESIITNIPDIESDVHIFLLCFLQLLDPLVSYHTSKDRSALSDEQSLAIRVLCILRLMLYEAALNQVLILCDRLTEERFEESEMQIRAVGV